MIVFRIRGVKVSFDIGFLSIISFVMLSGGKYYGLTFVSCMIHELGHLIQMFLSDESVSVISFNISGITIVPCHKKINSFWNDICILLGGPFANLVTALFSFYIAGGNINIFMLINLILGLFNLLPFSKLDGGLIELGGNLYYINAAQLQFIAKEWKWNTSKNIIVTEEE